MPRKSTTNSTSCDRPTEINLGPYVYTIRYVDNPLIVDGTESDGSFSSSKYLIKIRNDLDRTYEKEVFIHEILHACYAHARVEDDMDEEKTVDRLSAALTEVFMRNPSLVDYLR